MNDAAGPVNVIQTEASNFGSPHPGSRKQEHDRRVPQGLKRRSIAHAFDKPIDIDARQTRWKRRVNRPGFPGDCFA
jgi:hypothetical protein